MVNAVSLYDARVMRALHEMKQQIVWYTTRVYVLVAARRDPTGPHVALDAGRVAHLRRRRLLVG